MIDPAVTARKFGRTANGECRFAKGFGLKAARRRAVLFRVAGDTLYVANDGQRFDQRGVISICRENLSAKTDDGPDIADAGIADHELVRSIRDRRLAVYRIDRNQLREDARREVETSSDYAGRSLWELLQNADDALAPPGTSSADLIGAKGLGFKSVLEISERPSVHSGPFDFGFDADRSRELLESVQRSPPRLVFRLPHEVARDEQAHSLLREGYSTVVRLPFGSKQARNDILRRLSTLDPHFLLLCRHLDTVLIEQPEQPTRRLSVSRPRAAKLRGAPATLTSTQGATSASSDWRIWSTLAPAPSDNAKSLSVAIALPLSNGFPEPGEAEIPIHVFFPTREQIGARFLVHGSFQVDSNRNTLRRADDEDAVCKELRRLVADVVADVPAASVIRVFAAIVRDAKSTKVKRADKLIQQTIAQAVRDTAFVGLIGGGVARPGDVRIWEHDFHKVVPVRLAAEERLPVPELAPVFAELRSTFGAQSLRAADYARLISRTRAQSLELALDTLRVCFAGCLAGGPRDEGIVEALARAEVWPTAHGTFRSLTRGPSFLKGRPTEWPEWMLADTLHPDALSLLQGYDAAAAARWSWLLGGRLLGSADDWLAYALAPTLAGWGDEDWAQHGYEALALIERWVTIPEFASALPFVERPDDISVRAVLVRIARVPHRERWYPARDAYANRELGAPPEMAAYFKDIAGRFVVGLPSRGASFFGLKRWKALLRFLGVSWEPKIQFVGRDGSLYDQPAYRAFKQALADKGLLHINQEWHIEHFPTSLIHAGPSQVATCTAVLVAATANLVARWRKVDWADKTHQPSPFTSYAHFQLRRLDYLPQRPIAGRRGKRMAPFELFWPGKGISGITPVLDLGTTNPLRRAGLRSTFVDKLGVRNSLPRDWATWAAWSDELLAGVEAGAAPTPKAIRDFYDALLRTVRQPDGTKRITRVAAVRPGQQDEVVVEASAATLWIDQGRFENQEVLNGLGHLGKAVLPVRLERGQGAVEVLGVRPASDALAIQPVFEPASDRNTAFLEGRIASRKGPLAAICSTKSLPLKNLPKLAAVKDLRLKIFIDGELLADRIASSYFDGSKWLISLQAFDKWEAVATAIAEPFGGHAADLKYRFARVLRADRGEIATILADDGIPGYRIKEALQDFEEAEDGDGQTENDELETSSGDEPADGAGAGPGEAYDEGEGEETENTEEGDTEAGEGGEASRGAVEQRGSHQHGQRSHLTRRKLFSNKRDRDEGRRKNRRAAAEAASAAAGRGLRAEAWLLHQIATQLGSGWTCLANVRDDGLRETDVLISRGGEEWHVEVKCLSAELLFWSELEREKAERNPGRYFMALLVEAGDASYSVRWCWDPLNDLAPLSRRIEWLWEGSSEGPSLRDDWRLEAGMRWPERRADRYIHVVRLTQDELEFLDEDDATLQRLREKVGASAPSVEAGDVAQPIVEEA